VDKTKPAAPAQSPAKKKRSAWHRHPALIAAIPAVCTLFGGGLTVVLGQADVLPSAINPAPPPTTVLVTTTTTATATASSTETVTETPAVQPTDPQGSTAPPVLASGNLAITLQMSTGGKIGPGEYRAGTFAYVSAQVLDVSGHYPATGCYPTWVLKRGSTIVTSARSGSCQDSFSFLANSLEIRGIYHVTVSVVTDAGAKGTSSLDFKVT
jgi:hypothetical protein